MIAPFTVWYQGIMAPWHHIVNDWERSSIPHNAPNVASPAHPHTARAGTAAVTHAGISEDFIRDVEAMMKPGSGRLSASQAPSGLADSCSAPRRNRRRGDSRPPSTPGGMAVPPGPKEPGSAGGGQITFNHGHSNRLSFFEFIGRRIA
jgi:hypothetical protein